MQQGIAGLEPLPAVRIAELRRREGAAAHDATWREGSCIVQALTRCVQWAVLQCFCVGDGMGKRRHSTRRK